MLLVLDWVFDYHFPLVYERYGYRTQNELKSNEKLLQDVARWIKLAQAAERNQRNKIAQHAAPPTADPISVDGMQE
jgi:hypothetical protein